jgi:hypothetical protein
MLRVSELVHITRIEAFVTEDRAVRMYHNAQHGTMTFIDPSGLVPVTIDRDDVRALGALLTGLADVHRMPGPDE